MITPDKDLEVIVIVEALRLTAEEESTTMIMTMIVTIDVIATTIVTEAAPPATAEAAIGIEIGDAEALIVIGREINHQVDREIVLAIEDAPGIVAVVGVALEETGIVDLREALPVEAAAGAAVVARAIHEEIARL